MCKPRNSSLVCYTLAGWVTYQRYFVVPINVGFGGSFVQWSFLVSNQTRRSSSNFQCRISSKLVSKLHIPLVTILSFKGYKCSHSLGEYLVRECNSTKRQNQRLFSSSFLLRQKPQREERRNRDQNNWNNDRRGMVIFISLTTSAASEVIDRSFITGFLYLITKITLVHFIVYGRSKDDGWRQGNEAKQKNTELHIVAGGCGYWVWREWVSAGWVWGEILRLTKYVRGERDRREWSSGGGGKV